MSFNPFYRIAYSACILIAISYALSKVEYMKELNLRSFCVTHYVTENVILSALNRSELTFFPHFVVTFTMTLSMTRYVGIWLGFEEKEALYFGLKTVL